MAEFDALLSQGRALLRHARQLGRSWTGLPPQLEQDGTRDARELDRLQLSWALSYDYDATNPADVAVARRLLEDEVAWRERDPYQGIGETLELACWLVASARDPRDVWVLSRAKTANFDTECGLDRHFLFGGGVEATLAHVRHSHRPERDGVLGELVDAGGAPLIGEDELGEWLAFRATEHVTKPQDEPLEVWIDRAFALGRKTEARALVQRWAIGRERDTEFLDAYARYFAELGDYADVADLRAARASLLPDPFDRAGELCRAAEAERLAQRWSRALTQLEHAVLMHRTRPQWRELGLGRELVSAAFALANQATPAVAESALALGKELATTTPRLPPATIESAVKAAKRLGDELAAVYYGKMMAEASKA